jgi:hypothetical protein
MRGTVWPFLYQELNKGTEMLCRGRWGNAE